MAGSTKRAKTVEQDEKPATGQAAEAEKKEEKPLRPSQCRTYMRKTLARDFKSIVDGFIKGAQSGSCPHVKLATELLEPRPRAKRPKSGRKTIERWLDEMERGV